jgi:sugar phosphate isomerase/epimerase
MNPISMMAWRIGDRLDISAQVDWIEHQGFTGISLHASAGTPGQWRGIAPSGCPATQRTAWRKRLSIFQSREIHAPFAAVMQGTDSSAALATLAETLAFAGNIGADIVTVHAEVPRDAAALSPWQRDVRELASLARQNHVTVGLEITSGFEAVIGLAEPGLGVTLDVGHMYHRNAGPLAPFGGDIGAVVRLLGPALVHLHLHDVGGDTDHVAPGTGCVDWTGLFAALHGIDYAGMFCLELNPDRVTPEGIGDSRIWIAERWRETCR